MSKQLSIYQRLCTIAPVGTKTKATTSPYEAAVVACLDAQQQMQAAEMGYNAALENFSTADARRNSLKAQLLLSGNSAEVQRVNEKYDLGYGDYPVEQTANALGFSGGK